MFINIRKQLQDWRDLFGYLSTLEQYDKYIESIILSLNDNAPNQEEIEKLNNINLVNLYDEARLSLMKLHSELLRHIAKQKK